MEKERRRKANECLQRLPLVHLNLTNFLELAVESEHRESCAICLEEYNLNQVFPYQIIERPPISTS